MSTATVANPEGAAAVAVVQNPTTPAAPAAHATDSQPAPAPATTAVTQAPVEPPKPAEAKPVVADKPYDWKFAEGQKPAAEFLTALEGAARKHSVNAEGAQAIYEGLVAQVHASQKASAEAWTKAIANDAEVGGANLDRSKADVARVMAKVGTPELRAWFDTSGNGNHPEVFKAFVRLGRLLGEDVVVTGGEAPPAEKELKTLLWPGVGADATGRG